MARFKDYTGREWNLRLTLGILPDLKAVGCDLNEAVKSGEWLGDLLFGDTDKLAETLWVFLRDQAKTEGIGREAFDRLVDPDFCEAAAEAMQDEIIGFFHRGQRKQLRAQLPKVTAKLEQDMSRIADQATEKAVAAMEAKTIAILSGSGGSLAGT